VLAAVVVADQTIVSPTITVNFQGQSGGVTVWRTIDTKKDTTVSMSFDAIEEVSSTNSSYSPPISINMATQSFVWSAPVIITYQGYNATQLTLTSTLSNNAAFKCTALVFYEDAYVTHGSTTYQVLTDHVKLSFNIDNWPFVDNNGYLNIGVDLKFKGGSKGDPDSVKDKGDGKQKTVQFGGGALDLATTAVIDGVNKPVSAWVFTNGGSKTLQVGVQFQFPAFTSSLDYDPTLSVSFAMPRALLPSLLMVLCLALGMFASRV